MRGTISSAAGVRRSSSWASGYTEANAVNAYEPIVTPEMSSRWALIRLGRLAAGAAAATASICSSGAYEAARSAAKSTAAPPCE